MKLLIRTDGGLVLGNGHIIRMLALAQELKDRGFSLAFAISEDEYWINTIEAMGYEVHKLSNDEGSVDRIANIITKDLFSHLVYDTRNELSKKDLKQIKEKTGVSIVVIDTPEDTRLAADVALYPPVPQLNDWSWEEFEGKLYSGWEFVLLRKEFLKSTNKLKQTKKRLLLSFGSTDPFQITEKTLKVISDYEDVFAGWEITILVGPQFNRLETINAILGFKKLDAKVLQAPGNLANLFATVDLALIAFGVTAYELAACHVPFFAISPSPDHERSAKLFEENKLGISLGQIDGFEQRLIDAMINFTNIEVQIETSHTFYKQHTICNYEKIIKAINNYA